jgi:hypothetical protein
VGLTFDLSLLAGELGCPRVPYRQHLPQKGRPCSAAAMSRRRSGISTLKYNSRHCCRLRERRRISKSTSKQDATVLPVEGIKRLKPFTLALAPLPSHGCEHQYDYHRSNHLSTGQWRTVFRARVQFVGCGHKPDSLKVSVDPVQLRAQHPRRDDDGKHNQRRDCQRHC